MRNLLTAETAKTTAGKFWLALPVIGLALGAVTVLSLVSEAEAGIAAGATTAAAVTEDAVRYWMTMHLSAAMFGALFVTREYASGVIGRSILISGGNRRRLVTAKLVAATVMGTGYAVLATAVAALAPWAIMPRYGIEPEWTTRTWQVLAGVFVVTVLSAPWGVLIGWITRSPVVSVGFLVVATMGIEPYLTRLAPEVGRFLPGIAMSSLYLDTRPYLLPVLGAVAVIAAWLLAAWLLADRLLHRRDVL
ncbi:ABC transporter permease [Polymorphospora rubra]|uniref:ABC transporter permease n=1 Tax=Polymorphospora rubra TaxID=338584 RepID=UPI0033E28DCC